MEYNELLNRLGYFRTQKGYSARELSQMLDKNDAYINRLENNKFDLPVSVLLEIIKTLEITPQEFFADNYRTYKTDNELIDIIKNLPFDKKQTLIEFLKK